MLIESCPVISTSTMLECLQTAAASHYLFFFQLVATGVLPEPVWGKSFVRTQILLCKLTDLEHVCRLKN